MINIRQNVFETNSSSMHSIAIRKQGGIATEEFEEIERYNKMFIKALEDREQNASSVGCEYAFDADISFERYPFRALTTMFDKALYAIASVCGDKRIRLKGPISYGEPIDETDFPPFIKDVYSIIRKYIPTFKGFLYPHHSDGLLVIPGEESGKTYASEDWQVNSNWNEDKHEYDYWIVDSEGKNIPLVDTGEVVEFMEVGYIDHQSSGLFQMFMKTHNISLEEFLTDSKYVVFIDGDEYHFVDKLLKAGLFHENDFEAIVK